MRDIISRQAALAKIRTRLQDWAAYGNEEYRRGLYACEDMIISIPSVEPKTWRWVRKEKEINDCDGRRAYYWYECDNCGARPPKDQWGHEWHSDFCPNCGCAMMEGGEEE